MFICFDYQVEAPTSIPRVQSAPRERLARHKLPLDAIRPTVRPFVRSSVRLIRAHCEFVSSATTKTRNTIQEGDGEEKGNAKGGCE